MKSLINQQPNCMKRRGRERDGQRRLRERERVREGEKETEGGDKKRKIL